MKAFFEARARLETRLPALKHLHEMFQMRRSMYVFPKYFNTEPDEVLKNMHSVQVIYRGNANNRDAYQVSVVYHDQKRASADIQNPKNKGLIEALRTQNLSLPCVSSREDANKTAEQLARAGTAKTHLKGHLFAAVNPSKVTHVEIVDPMHVTINLGCTKLEIEDNQVAINLMMSELAIKVIQNGGSLNKPEPYRGYTTLTPR